MSDGLNPFEPTGRVLDEDIPAEPRGLAWAGPVSFICSCVIWAAVLSRSRQHMDSTLFDLGMIGLSAAGCVLAIFARKRVWFLIFASLSLWIFMALLP